VNESDHTIRKYTLQGEPLLVLGTSEVASDTGYDRKISRVVPRSGPPFNRPTGIAVAPNGELYASDGYGNARVHRFAADGRLIQSWGSPGVGPGQFHVPHGIEVAPDGRVLVADRENDRIQVFGPLGEFLEQWTDVQRPCDLCLDRQGRVVVCELAWVPGECSQVHGPIHEKLPARISILTLDGEVLERGSNSDGSIPGALCAPHALCLDSHGDLYVGEVCHTHSKNTGLPLPPGFRTLHKFVRKP
jgi:hypothetical protein